MSRIKFRGEVILLTGVPAVGKSTVADALAERVRRLSVVHFGDIIRGVVARVQGRRVGEDQLRRSTSAIVTPSILEQSRRELIRVLRRKRTQHHILIDSHAVSRVPYGFRSTPDSPRYVRMMGLGLIVHLFASPADISSRRRGDPAGRPALSAGDPVRYEFLQAAVSTYYAAESTCSVCLVDASGSVNSVVARVLGCLEEIGVRRK